MSSNKVIRGKCLLVGDSTVGKSTISQVFSSDEHMSLKNYLMTTGVDIFTKLISIPESNYSVEIIFYDCAGKECFYNVVQKTWDHPNMLVLVFDLTNDVSLSGAIKWFERVKNFKPDIDLPVIIIGNKNDSFIRRNVKQDELFEFCRKNDVKFFECSAKDNQGVNDAIMYLVKHYYELYKKSLIDFEKLI